MVQEIVDLMHLWSPPPSVSVCEWADNELYLSPEESAEPGKYSTDRAPFQRGIMNAFTEEDVEEVVVMSSSQVGKSLILKAVIGYHVDIDPGPIMVVQPSVGMAEAFSKDRIAPMFRDTPALRTKVADAKSRNSNNTILHKTFVGGHLTFVGAEAPAGLAMRPIRILLCDEVDRYPPSAGKEGDPVNLAKKRTITFRDRKRIGLFSTPGEKGASRIERAFRLSDQRHFQVPCPHCSHMHTLSWDNVLMTDGNPDTASLVCPACGALIGDEHKSQMLEKGVWVAYNPGSRVPGFHLNELYSPWRRTTEIARAFIEAKGNPDEERTWWNTAMGLPFERIGDKADAQALSERRENYDIHTLPEGVRMLTAGLDVQKDRIEMEIVGWGHGEESWGVEYLVFNGDPSQPDIWSRVDQCLITTVATTTDGRNLRVAAACIDSGGHHVQQVYEFSTPRSGRNIWAIKGQFGARPVWPARVSRSRKYKGHIVRMIGVDTAKDTIYARWHIAEAGKPGCTHFPISYDDEWFRQATAESRVATLDKRGSEIRSWIKPKDARNEATDCRTYAYAALQGLKIERRFTIASKVVHTEPLSQSDVSNETKVPTSTTVNPDPVPVNPTRQRMRRRGSSQYLRR